MLMHEQLLLCLVSRIEQQSSFTIIPHMCRIYRLIRCSPYTQEQRQRIMAHIEVYLKTVRLTDHIASVAQP